MPGPPRAIRDIRAARALALVLVGALALGGAACRRRTARAGPPLIVPAPKEEPAPTATQPPGTQPQPEAKPENAPAPEAPALVVPPPKATSSKPRPTPPERPAPEPPESPAPKPTPPQISPQLSPEEQAAAERRTNEDIGTAERNLQVAYGRTLNTAQNDMVEKIRGFLGQSREAMRAGDWVRARNLAHKARLLSVELVNSL